MVVMILRGSLNSKAFCITSTLSTDPPSIWAAILTLLLPRTAKVGGWLYLVPPSVTLIWSILAIPLTSTIAGTLKNGSRVGSVG